MDRARAGRLALAYRGAILARPGFSVAAVVVALSFASRASASDELPGEVRQAIAGMECTPQCVICHETNEGGSRTATKPFAEVGAALLSSDVANFKTALETSDVNEDAVLDVQRLKQGLNPNTSDDFSICVPTYGCGVRLAPTPIDRGAAGAALLALLALVGAARRQQR